LLTRLASGFAGAASLFNAVQASASAYRRFGDGDRDAAWLDTLAGVAFAGTAGASVAMVAGVEATFFGAALGLGPAGWAVLLTAVAVGLTYAAVAAEDSDAEIFVARNAHWSKSDRSEPRYRNWLDEAEAFTGLWFGVKAELRWGDTVTGAVGIGLDRVHARITLAEPDAAEGWRYRLWVTGGAAGREIEIYNECSSNVEPFASSHIGDRQPEFRPWNPKSVTNGREFKLHRYTYTMEKGAVVIEHAFDVDDRIFRRARLEFEYWPDAANRNDKARFEIKVED
jgi:hypothetical protein